MLQQAKAKFRKRISQRRQFCTTQQAHARMANFVSGIVFVLLSPLAPPRLSFVSKQMLNLLSHVHQVDNFWKVCDHCIKSWNLESLYRRITALHPRHYSSYFFRLLISTFAWKKFASPNEVYHIFYSKYINKRHAYNCNLINNNFAIEMFSRFW